ncbi:MAG: HAD family hydrolase [Lachnospiraceae bacterium]|nr:HAD family hydrolase [Lachnospiraceae bacterium]
MIKAVIFDMYETLITHFQSPLYFGAQMAADAGIPEQKFQALWEPTEHDRTIGKLTLEDTLENILKENGRYSKELLNLIVQKRIKVKEECFNHLHDQIIPLLRGLKEKGIQIGLISNCFSEEAKVIRKSILFPYFDAVCLSYEQGLKKPDIEIYRRCIDKLNVEAGECLYVGDGGSSELEAAKSIGMKTVQAVWYLQDGTGQPCGRKADFEQMENPMDILKKIFD